MSLVADRVLETTTVIGTGAATLLGAATGYQTFFAAKGTGTPVRYCIEAVDVDGAPSGQWEIGTGSLAAPTTLTRTTPIRGSAGEGVAVAFAVGPKRVFVTASVEDFPQAVTRETPAGVVNGSNPTFTLAAAPAPTGSLTVWVNGLAQRAGAGNDFTLAGAVLTFPAGAIPQAGDVIEASYST